MPLLEQNIEPIKMCVVHVFTKEVVNTSGSKYCFKLFFECASWTYTQSCLHFIRYFFDVKKRITIIFEESMRF